MQVSRIIGGFALSFAGLGSVAAGLFIFHAWINALFAIGLFCMVLSVVSLFWCTLFAK